jgi:hypothetical protein
MMDTNLESSRDVLAALFFLVVLPAVMFLLLRRSRRTLRITLTLLVFVAGAIVLPNFVRARTTVSKNSCVSNLRLIQEAKHRWAEVNHKNPTNIPTLAELFNEQNEPGYQTAPQCPLGGIYSPRAVGEDAECSIGPPGHTVRPP